MPRRAIRERNILFLCMDNSCSSQIAEAVARRLAPPKTRVFSAGITPGEIHPTVGPVMQEVGVDISGQSPKNLASIPISEIDLVITLGIAKERCPSLPERIKVDHWPVPDMRRVLGGEAAMRAVLRHLRDEIDKKVAALFLDHWRNIT
jgi:arsenate reductase